MIYFDNAATSFPKPREVWEAQADCMRSYCGNPGRGSHRLAMLAAERIYECREELASLFGSYHPERVIFTPNATSALNLAIKGLVRAGDHVLISDLEHNAVWRPICRLTELGVIDHSVFPSLAALPGRTPADICREIEARIRPNTRLLVCTHHSNILPAVMPLAEIGALCRRRGILFVVDAAQSAGHLPIHMEAMGIDALCLPGHKGLFGVQGSGCLLLGERAEPEPLLEGGSGLHSLDSAMPEELPERLEAGTLPTPAIVGLCAGVKFIKRVGLQAIAQKEALLAAKLTERMESLAGVGRLLPHLEGLPMLIHTPQMPAERLGAELDRLGICVRAGFHCTALAHRTAGTPSDGAIRISPGFFNTPAEIDRFWLAMRTVLG